MSAFWSAWDAYTVFALDGCKVIQDGVLGFFEYVNGCSACNPLTHRCITGNEDYPYGFDYDVVGVDEDIHCIYGPPIH